MHNVTIRHAYSVYQWQVLYKEMESALSSYYAYVSCNLLLMALEVDTHTYINICRQNDFKKPSACGPVASTCLVYKFRKEVGIRNEPYMLSEIYLLFFPKLHKIFTNYS